MERTESAKDRLLGEAKRLFWANGYGAVSVRDVAGAAGVDIALISRYFGGKRGLFEATLEGAFTIADDFGDSPETMMDVIVSAFVHAPRDESQPSVLRMIVMNAHDEEVGGIVTAAVQASVYARSAAILGSEEKGALLIAVVLGFSLAEKSLHLPGIAPPASADYEAQLRRLMQVAIGE